MSAPAARVAGWDLLRGLCALAVASYHLLYWLGLATLPALGTYGVYLFFVLSGASLAYTYAPADVGTVRRVLAFLASRWLRLAPLYLLLCMVFIAMLAARNGALVDHLGERLVLNASFAFGLRDPAVWALLVGGWSLGIEFVFYLAFPLLRVLAAQRFVRGPLLALLALVQLAWIEQTIGRSGWDAGVVAYHQAPAFAAYFFAGCLIGHARREQRSADLPLPMALLAWCGLGLLLAVPREAGQELVGWQGAVLACACVGAVWIGGQARVGRRLEPLAAFAGDATYGVYLLHPLLLWGIAWFVLPIEAMAPALRWAMLAGVLLVAAVLAWASERRLERPIRRRGRDLLAASAARQSEAASISS